MPLAPALRTRLPWILLAVLLVGIVAVGLAFGAGLARSKTNAITESQASSIEQGDRVDRGELVRRFGEPRSIRFEGGDTCSTWGRDGRLADDYVICTSQAGRVTSVTGRSAGAWRTVRMYGDTLRDSLRP